MAARFFLALAIGTLALLGIGAQGLWTWIRNPRPVEITFSNYVKSQNSAAWLRLKDCRVDHLNLVWHERNNGSIDEVLIPLRVPGSTDGTIHVLLASRSPEVLDLADRKRVARTEEEMIQYAKQKSIAWNSTRDIEGLIRYGIHYKDKDFDQLAETMSALAPDFVVLDEGPTPKPFFTLILLIGGVGLSVVLYFWGRNLVKQKGKYIS